MDNIIGLMGYDKGYSYLYKEKERVIDKELGPRYRSSEAIPGESYREFKTRIISEEMQAVRNKARDVYPAWIQAPGESDLDFKKRLVAKRINEQERIPAWVKAPNETDEEFKKRFTSLPKSL